MIFKIQKEVIALFGLMLSFGLLPQYSLATELFSLEEVIHTSIKNSPEIESKNDLVFAKEQETSSTKAAYLPTVNFEAVDSTGFAGSSSGLGIAGAMGSPFRSGYAIGVEARQNLFDFGRTSAKVSASRKSESIAKLNEKISEYQLALQSTVLFYQCSALKSSLSVWQKLMNEYATGKAETERYVSTGQRSVVDRYLVADKYSYAVAKVESLQIKLKETESRLQLVTGVQNKTCPELPEKTSTSETASLNQFDHSVFLQKARLSSEQAEDVYKWKKRDHLPSLVAVGSFAELESARLVQKKDYSLGIGLVIPLFNGMKTTNEENQAAYEHHAAEMQAVEEDRKVKMMMSELTAKLESNTKNWVQFDQEYKMAWEGFNLAKRRYLKFQGTLSDLLAAIGCLEKASSSLLETKFDWLVTQEQLKLLN